MLKKIISRFFLTVAVLLIIGMAGMVAANQHPAARTISEYQKDYQTVNIIVCKNGDVILSEDEEVNTDYALLFLTGAGVEPAAYIPVFAETAEEGYDVILSKGLFNFFYLNKSVNYYKTQYPQVSAWIISGHSMGGFFSNIALNKDDSVQGIITLASVPYFDISDCDKNYLSIFGTDDGIVNDRDKKFLHNFNDDVDIVYIEGGNHAQFGDYGIQSKKDLATITKEEQWSMISKTIVEWLKEHYY